VVAVVLAVFTARMGWLRVRAQIERHVVMKLYWSDLEQQKMRLPKANVSRFADIWVVSLRRVERRRKHVQNMLEGVRFNFVDAIDGKNDAFSWELLVRFIGEHRMKTAGLLDPKCAAEPTSCVWNRAKEREKAKIALDLTYLLLMYKISKHPAGPDAAHLIIEDDAILNVEAEDGDASGFFQRLNTRVLPGLPADWDLFMLCSSGYEGGAAVAPGLRVLRSGVGTVAFSVRGRFAKQLVDQHLPVCLPHMYIDLCMCGMLPETGRAHGYVADPFLARHAGFYSEIG
jgi:hypothetical protein